jgi:hypothetical protein
MKQIWPDYSYSPATNVLTLTGLNIDRDQLLLVAAPERGRIMYNFADSSVTASAYTAGANTALTLVASTAGLTTTASLVIYYDDQLQSTAITISNFPATQPVSIASVTVGNTVTIAGTVTANPTGTQTIAGTVTIGAGTAQIGSVTASIGLNLVGPSVRADSGFSLSTRGMMVVGGISTSDVGSDNEYRELKITSTGEALVRGTVTIGNSVTIGSLPTISGTVTANGGDFSAIVGESMPAKAVAIGFYSGDDAGIAQVNDSNRKMPISGTVTVGNSVTIASLPALAAGTAQIGSVTASISNSVTIASLPAISGTVTANTFALQGTAVTTSDFTSTTASTVLANYNAGREVLTIFNEGAGNLHICAGATCTTIAYQVRLSAGDYYEVPNHQTTITHSAVFATAGTARVTEVS